MRFWFQASEMTIKMRLLWFIALLLVSVRAFAQCPTVLSACPSPSYNNTTVGGLLTAAGGTLAITPSGGYGVIDPGAGTLLLKSNGNAGTVLSFAPFVANQTFSVLGNVAYSGAPITGNNIAQSTFKTTTSGSLTTGQQPVFAFYDLGDTIASPSSLSSVNILNVDYTSAAGATGSRWEISTQGTAGASSSYLAIGGIQTTEVSTYNMGGTSGTPSGALYGGNFVAQALSGATFLGTTTGLELDVEVASGASTRDKVGLLIDLLSGDAVRATGNDIGIALDQQATGVGWLTGLSFGRTEGHFPVASTGTLIGGTDLGGGAFTVANGIDWHLGTASGNWLQFGSIFSVDGAGDIVFNGNLNGWKPQLSARNDLIAVTAPGSGYVKGDTITLNDGCATHGVLTVTTLSGSGVANNTQTVGAVCAQAPSNPVAQLSTSGSGTGATFTLTYAPIAAAVGTVPNGLTGNLFSSINNIGPAYQGQESTAYTAGRANLNYVSGDFVNIFGLNAGGGACPTSITGSGSNSFFGTDAARDFCGGQSFDVFGVAAVGGYAHTNVNSFVAMGNNAAGHWDSSFSGAVKNVVIGSAACIGAGSQSSPGASYKGTTCIGGATGTAITSGNNLTIVGASLDQTSTSGSQLILIGSGNVAVEPPTATTNGYINVENIWTVSGTGTPSTSVTTIAGTLNVVAGRQANGTAGVSCAANTVVLTTFTVTSGLVTHC